MWSTSASISTQGRELGDVDREVQTRHYPAMRQSKWRG